MTDTSALVISDEERDMIAAGNEAEALMSSDAFRNTLKRVRDTYVERLLASDPSESAERERMYVAVASLSDIVNAIYADVLVRDEILARHAGDDALTSQE